MAVSVFHLRSPFTARSCTLLRIKLLCNEAHFADDSKKKLRLYETLGVSPNATHGEIKKAYYDLSFRYHPDRNENCDIASAKFKEVTEAYEILGNFKLKKKYDRGVPMAHMKKSDSVPVEHTPKYQEFFDSRTARHEYKDRSADFDDFAKFSEKRVDEDLADEKWAKAINPPKSVQITMLLFFGVVWYVFNGKYGPEQSRDAPY